MASFNKVVLLGNLTRDVELRYTPSGAAVTNIGLAMNDKRKKGDEWIDEPVFIDVTLWSRNAEIASEYLSKGSPVLIEGRLKREEWEKDGVKHSKILVVGETLQLLGTKGDKKPKKETASSTVGSEPSAAATPPEGSAEDIPF